LPQRTQRQHEDAEDYSQWYSAIKSVSPRPKRQSSASSAFFSASSAVRLLRLPNDAKQPGASAGANEALRVVTRQRDTRCGHHAPRRALHVLLDRVAGDLGIRIAHARDDLVPRAAVGLPVRCHDMMGFVL